MSHKPRRDSASDAKELDDYRKENRKLKRDVSRLEKLLTKALVHATGTTSNPEEPSEPPLSTEGVNCPECGDPLRIIPLGVKTLRACKGCGWRKAV